MGQYEVSLVVGGRSLGSDYFDEAKETLSHIDVLKSYDYKGKTAEVFVTYHNHPLQLQWDGCSCAYGLDSVPFWTNKKES